MCWPKYPFKRLKNTRRFRRTPNDLGFLLLLTTGATVLGFAVSLGHLTQLSSYANAFRENGVLLAALVAIVIFLYRVDVSEMNFEVRSGVIKFPGGASSIRFYSNIYVENTGRRDGYVHSVQAKKVVSPKNIEDKILNTFDFDWRMDDHKLEAQNHQIGRIRAKEQNTEEIENLVEELEGLDTITIVFEFRCSDTESSELADRYQKYLTVEFDIQE